MLRIIVTAIGCPGGPSIIQALREDKNLYIIGTDVRENMAARFLVDRFVKVPAGNNPDFIPFMVDLVKRYRVAAILPLATFELLPLSKNQAVFEEKGCRVCVSDYQSLEIANNRFLLYNFFKNASFIPKFRILQNGDQLGELLKEFGFPEEKVVVKPFIGHGSIGLRIINNDVDLYEDYRNNKPNHINIPFQLAKSIFSHRELDDILLSEYLSGPEFGVDTLIDPKNNKIIKAIIRDNGEVFHSEISNGKIIEQSEILYIVEQIVSSLKLAYTINIDIKTDKKGCPKLIEINPRIPATSFLAVSSGLNLPLYSIYLAINKKIPKKAIKKDKRIFSYRGFIVVNNKGKIKSKAL